MSELFLIAHKVRGAPAFDIAIQMPCPECQAWQDANCNECDSLGYWWIIPTSGHRAYPFNVAALSEDSMLILDAMPLDLPDHYPNSASRHEPKRDLLAALGLNKPAAPMQPFPRRI